MADSYFEVTWTDPVTDAKGYLVIDRLVRGISSGGLRMRAGCTLAEVRGLAQGMTLKEAMHYEEGARYVPLGGAKGGIDFDPYSADAEQVLFRYLAAMKPLIEQRWTMGGGFRGPPGCCRPRHRGDRPGQFGAGCVPGDRRPGGCRRPDENRVQCGGRRRQAR
ncbi:Glu/Leu/Phe/Val dehydrogenase dimerization domain-containing protein [Mycolicibacterium mageritense]|uniref:Glu/Leu/Phe/Val dehydrogenase dimerization domain-containing protein n=1 Tax=Mycolicibacterium mageritense TaxID=53462 RepID=UPI001E2CFC77|nr:Glu/Leu/Phe/Val dehydrogenase dimerization domain-containing protein [Mycolicibacterium mageritense]MCC9185752.1 hypothetical protein [Mycolicibacterium mageritense]